MKILRSIVLIFFILCFITALKTMQNPETNLISAFLSCNSKKQNDIAKLAKLSSDKLNIIIESNSIENLQDLKTQLENRILTLEENKDDTEEVLNIYKNYPTNFIAPETKKLLEQKEYKKLEKNSLQMLYNPLGIYISPPDKDPYLFATDFVLNIKKTLSEDYAEKNGKIYALIRFECKDIQDIKKIKEIIKELEAQNKGNIYPSGVPVHTYETQNNSKIEINIICLLSSIMLIVLCRKFLGSYKILIPVTLSILFGFLFGFTFSALIFKKLHILTFVFSTSLIGISLDYSIHYYLTGANPEFRKSLFISCLSTVLTFGVLYFLNIEIMKQIAVFVSFGLAGVYIFVRMFLPLFKPEAHPINFKPIDISDKKLPILILLALILISGFIRLNFNDSIKDLYKPVKALLYSENLYRNIFASKPVNFVLIKGENINNILEKEEDLLKNLAEIKHFALSDFISSKKKQEENIQLVKSLYKLRLNSYAKFLDEKTRNKISEENSIFDSEKFPLNEKFMLDKTTSYIALYADDLNIKGFETIKISDEMNKIVKDFRKKCLFIIPVIFIILYSTLRIFYTGVQTAKLIISPFLGGITSLALICLLSGSINVFHLIAFILVIGFSMDYSIFRLNIASSGDKKSELAILISCISTVFSFFMLALTGFKVISSLGAVLFSGILISYILSLLFIPSAKEKLYP